VTLVLDLDFDLPYDTAYQSIWRIFYHAAADIMLEHDLVCESGAHAINALELYLYHPTLWPDPSTDRADVQGERGRWYVSKQGFRTQWRIDISAGDRHKGIYAGILVAAIGKRNGSGLALNTILSGDHEPRKWDYDANQIKKIEEINNSSILGSESLRLEKRPQRRNGSLMIGARKDLPQGCEDPFKSAPLRISVDPPSATWPSLQQLNMKPLEPD